ncbi:hypothetical protein BT67DRAFT_387281 [Trichocladium antarcticum]|uniref:Indole-diterpene biosynthesis protein PaxU n=1 Tax=Trichocladium antarcticum TaxID=1450529 RepID=A0AAN6ZBE0_9PEZI|nr:hypothetical protein BT67DRAFT_387281 [Trichocladium antarcticum]
MQKLSPSVYVYRPAGSSMASTTATTSQSPGPKLILAATWMGARDQHIAKYLAEYQTLYPSSPILLIRSEPWHFMRRRAASLELAHAAPVLGAIFPTVEPATCPPANVTSPTTPELLIHAFSNGGVGSLQTLRRALGPEAAALPPYTLLLDSAPGAFRYRDSFLAFTTGLNRPVLWLVSPVMHALCAWYWFWHVLIGRGRTGPLAVLAASLNDEGHRGREVRRAYVYSDVDKLVCWRDVEAHARDAQAKGFGVRSEMFEGSPHVAHARTDAERYWGIVKETWEGKSG